MLQTKIIDGLLLRDMVLAGAALLGLGFGGYIAVEQALVSQVLPSATARGKDLGILNIANSAPQVLGPALAALLVTRLGGYPALYLATAAVTIGGSLVLHPSPGKAARILRKK